MQLQFMTIEQISQLSDEELRVKVAEACGWMIVEGLLAFPPLEWVKARMDPDAFSRIIAIDYTTLPNYPASLDACAEFERTLTEEECAKYTQALVSLTYGLTNFRLVTASPRARCIAFLATKGGTPK